MTTTTFTQTISNVSFSVFDRIIMSKAITVLVFFYVACCYVAYKLMWATVSSTYLADALLMLVALPLTGLAWCCSERYAVERKNPTQYDVSMTRWVYLITLLVSLSIGLVMAVLAK